MNTVIMRGGLGLARGKGKIQPQNISSMFNVSRVKRSLQMPALRILDPACGSGSLNARLEQERTMLSRQIGATDGAIDKLVYELYGLTEEEIVIVEGSAK